MNEGSATKPLNAVIAEDEPILRAELREVLGRLWPELVICAEAEDGIEAVNALNAHSPDIMFLDIQMPGMSGLEIAKLASGRCHVAFVTAYDEYAVAAFEQGAVDYVMKPFSPARLAATVSRLKDKIARAPANLDGLLKALAVSSTARFGSVDTDAPVWSLAYDCVPITAEGHPCRTSRLTTSSSERARAGWRSPTR